MKSKPSRKRKTPLKIDIVLTPADIAWLKSLTRRGTRKASEISRAHILLMSHVGKTNAEIEAALNASHFMIADVRHRFLKRKKDVKKTVTDAPRPGRPKRLLPAHEAFVTATACTEAPPGHAHWTIPSLKNELLKTYTELERVGNETIRRILVKNKLKPWREKNVVRANAHPSLP